MEVDGLARITYRKYSAKLRVQNLIRNQPINTGALFVARVDCYQRGRPKAVLVVCPVDLFPDFRCLNNGERPGEFGVSVNQRSVEFKDIQDRPQCEYV